MLIDIPEFSLVLLIGPSGAGQMSFIERHVPVSALITAESALEQSLSVQAKVKTVGIARDHVHHLLTQTSQRLKARLKTVIDASGFEADARKSFVDLARRYHARLVAIAFDVPNEGIENSRSSASFLSQKRNLNHEGFHEIYTLRSEQDIANVHLRWITPLHDKRQLTGPFDVIGDIHGCADELVDLLHALGYTVEENDEQGPSAWHPEGRMMVFVGDMVDRGPAIVRVLQLVMNSIKRGTALCVVGNHENKLVRYLAGRKVKISHGLEKTIEQLDRAPATLKSQLPMFLNSLSDHLILDQERLVVAHAGIREDFIGRSSGEIRSFCLYGETNGDLDEYGLPVRLPWARKYGGEALVVYGHTPVPEPQWVSNTVNIDTGCVYGGALSALRYPEKTITSVTAKKTYYEPRRPFKEEGRQGKRLNHLRREEISS